MLETKNSMCNYGPSLLSIFVAGLSRVGVASAVHTPAGVPGPCCPRGGSWPVRVPIKRHTHHTAGTILVTSVGNYAFAYDVDILKLSQTQIPKRRPRVAPCSCVCIMSYTCNKSYEITHMDGVQVQIA
jgi:hypothetical protein